ncbi:hypothetical protein DYGSA30_23390 [Dyella sp. GSA-30]|nr:hypothetical protein DYGSA30_23390 [Dyella sp. GSA-30]
MPIVFRRYFLRALAACLLLGAGQVLAQTQPPKTSSPPPKPAAPAPRAIVPPASQYQYRQAQQQQQVTDQLQRQQQRQQLQQGIQNTARLPNANNPALLNQADNADKANQDRYRAQQQDLLDRYQNAATPPPVTAPARSSSR